MIDIVADFVGEDGSVTHMELHSGLNGIKVTISKNTNPVIRVIEMSEKEAMILKGLIELIRPAYVNP